MNRRPVRPAGTRAWLAELPRLADRPVEADDRSALGHFEGGLVIGASGTSGIATVVERKRHYTTWSPCDNRFRNPGTLADATARKIRHVPDLGERADQFTGQRAAGTCGF